MKDINSIIVNIDEFLGVDLVDYKVENQAEIKDSITLPEKRIYNIPAYQREIRWNDEQVSRLIEDLIQTSKFLGSVMVSTFDGKTFDVLDGQQRLTVLNMIIEYICTIRKNGKFERCKLVNESISCFDELYSIDFDISAASISDEVRLEYKRKDRLNQIDRLLKVWLQIKKSLDGKSSSELSGLKDNILASKINLVINYEGKGSISKKQCILQYLDINNKSVPLDHIDILKAYLFKDNFDLFSDKWADIQKQISELKCHNIEYDVQNIFYHYFLCEANKKLNWTLTGLQYKFLTVNGNRTEPKYKKGQHITEVITDYSFYEDMMSGLGEYLKFLEYLCSNQSIDEAFNCYCVKTNGEILVDVSKKNIFYLSKAIIGLKEQIPKMMLMKYFFEVLNKEKATSEEYKLIYYIYFCAIMFACLDEKKESKTVASLVVSKDWNKGFKRQAEYYFDNKMLDIWYMKKISRMGYSLETGGQELPRHIFAIKYYWKKSGNKVEPKDPKKLCIYLSSTMERTMEHFLINKSRKIEFKYGPDDSKGVYFYQKKFFGKYISCPINYLVLDEEVNKNIGNGSIKEKIEKLISEDEKIWGNPLVFEYFKIAAEVFGKGSCPYDFKSIESEEEVKDLFDSYFENEFLIELQEYEKLIKGKRCSE